MPLLGMPLVTDVTEGSMRAQVTTSRDQHGTRIIPRLIPNEGLRVECGVGAPCDFTHEVDPRSCRTTNNATHCYWRNPSQIILKAGADMAVRPNPPRGVFVVHKTAMPCQKF